MRSAVEEKIIRSWLYLLKVYKKKVYDITEVYGQDVYMFIRPNIEMCGIYTPEKWIFEGAKPSSIGRRCGCMPRPDPQVQVLVEANFCMFLLNLKALLCWSRFFNKYTQFLGRTSI